MKYTFIILAFFLTSCQLTRPVAVKAPVVHRTAYDIVDDPIYTSYFEGCDMINVMANDKEIEIAVAKMDMTDISRVRIKGRHYSRCVTEGKYFVSVTGEGIYETRVIEIK